MNRLAWFFFVPALGLTAIATATIVDPEAQVFDDVAIDHLGKA